MTSMLEALKLLQRRGVPLTGPERSREAAERVARDGVTPDEIYVSPAPQPGRRTTEAIGESPPSAPPSVSPAPEASDDDTYDENPNQNTTHAEDPRDRTESVSGEDPSSAVVNETLAEQLAKAAVEAAAWPNKEWTNTPEQTVEPGPPQSNTPCIEQPNGSRSVDHDGDISQDHDEEFAPIGHENQTLILDNVTQKQIAAAIAGHHHPAVERSPSPPEEQVDRQPVDIVDAHDQTMILDDGAIFAEGTDNGQETGTLSAADGTDDDSAASSHHECPSADDTDAANGHDFQDECAESDASFTPEAAFEDDVDIDEALRRAVGDQVVNNPSADAADAIDCVEDIEPLMPPIETERNESDELCFQTDVTDDTAWDAIDAIDDAGSPELTLNEPETAAHEDTPCRSDVFDELPEYPPNSDEHLHDDDDVVPPEAFVPIEDDDLEAAELIDELEYPEQPLEFLDSAADDVELPEPTVQETTQAADNQAPDNSDELREDVADLKGQICRLEELVLQLLERPPVETTQEAALIDEPLFSTAEESEKLPTAMGSQDEPEEPQSAADLPLDDEQPVTCLESSEATRQADEDVDAAWMEAAEMNHEFEAESAELDESLIGDSQSATDEQNAECTEAECMKLESPTEVAETEVSELRADEEEEEEAWLSKHSAQFFTPPSVDSSEIDAVRHPTEADTPSLKVVNPAEPAEFASHFLGTEGHLEAAAPVAPQFVDHLTTIDADGAIQPGTQAPYDDADSPAIPPSAVSSSAPGPDPAATRERILSVLGAGDAQQKVDPAPAEDVPSGGPIQNESASQLTEEVGDTSSDREQVMPETTAYEVLLRSNLDNEQIAGQYASLWTACLEAASGRQHLALTAFGCHDEPHVAQIVAQMATMLSRRKSQSILIVDGNIISQHLSKALQASERVGLAEIASGSRDWHECVVETASPNLSLIPSGLDIAQDFDDERISTCIEEWSLDYDFVLIDGGFVGSPLTKPLIEFSNRAMMLIRLGKTQRAEASAAIGAIKEMKLTTHGCIVTNCERPRV